MTFYDLSLANPINSDRHAYKLFNIGFTREDLVDFGGVYSLWAIFSRKSKCRCSHFIRGKIRSIGEKNSIKSEARWVITNKLMQLWKILFQNVSSDRDDNVFKWHIDNINCASCKYHKNTNLVDISVYFETQKRLIFHNITIISHPIAIVLSTLPLPYVHWIDISPFLCHCPHFSLDFRYLQNV